MEITALVIEDKIDPQVLEQIQTLREIRLGLAVKQLAEIKQTASKLSLKTSFEQTKMAQELQAKIQLMRERQADVGRIYADEVEFYLSVLA